MDKLLHKHSLDAVCALQWQRCVEKSYEALSKMPKDKVLHIKYENFVRDPEVELSSILNFLDLQVDSEEIALAVEGVNEMLG